MLRREEETPCQLAMKHYFSIPERAKKFPGRKRNTLPTVINNDIKKAAEIHTLPISNFESTEDLKTLKIVAMDREQWRNMCKQICKPAEGNTQQNE